jgi:hypothetical protein
MEEASASGEIGMRGYRWFGVVRSVMLLAVSIAGLTAARAQSPVPKRGNGVTAVETTDKDVRATQTRLLELLRVSPTLTSVVARDPTLLANQDYVKRSNPELANFLEENPEVARNPDYYLFAGLNGRGRPDQVLERKLWPYLNRSQEETSGQIVMRQIGPFLVFLCFLGALIWLIRVFLENRRWGRVFRMQTEVHGKLIDKFGSNEELLSYMGTDAGKRFLEAAPISVEFEQGQRMPSIVAKVLIPLQIGVVMVLLGTGLLSLRNSLPDLSVPLLVFGVVVLMPGIGFILSAGIAWMLAGRLGLMPERNGSKADRFDSKERP